MSTGSAEEVAGVAGGALLLAGTLSALTAPLTAGAAAATTVGYTTPTANGHGYRHGAVPRIVSAPPGTSVPSVTPTPSGTTNGPVAAAGRLRARPSPTGEGSPPAGWSAQGSPPASPRSTSSSSAASGAPREPTGAAKRSSATIPDAEAPALQTLYQGLGTRGEQWSGIVTQYCDGVAIGATSCNSGSQNIPYPSPGVLAGTWYDNSASATSQTAAGATGNQLAAEAESAAVHFGNLTQASNRDTQYVIASPTGTDPDGWTDPVNGYCAYHDDTHDPFIDGGGAVSGPILAFTNMPYIPDAGGSCGANMVNSGASGTLDGATSTASHEYAETLTDQFPETTPVPGWSDASGDEIADICDYISAPNPGAAYNLTLATGTVVVQGLWSNAANAGKGGCVQNAPVPTFTPTITSFAPKVAPAGAWVTIAGNDLNGATHVAFDGIGASIVSDSTTAVVAVVPAAASVGPLTVTTAGGTAVSHKSFLPAPTVTGLHAHLGSSRSAGDDTGIGSRRGPEGVPPRQEDDRRDRHRDSDHRARCPGAR